MRRGNYERLLEKDPTKQAKPASDQDRIAAIGTKLSFSERQSLEHEIEQTERSLKQDLKGEKNDPRVLRQLYHKKMLLAHDDELVAHGGNKDVVHSEIKALEDEIVKEIPSKNEMWAKTGSNESQQAIRHNLHFQRPDMDAKVKRWQNLKKMLEPDNPYAQSLDTIRPDK